MRAILLYLAAGIGWAFMAAGSSFQFEKLTFWRDAAIWPVQAAVALLDLLHAVPAQWIERASIGFGVALAVYVLFRPPFAGPPDKDKPRRRVEERR